MVHHKHQNFYDFKNPDNDPEDRKYTSLLIFGLLMIIILGALKWSDIVKKNPNGEYVLTEERQKDLDRKVKKFDQAELYYLLAKTSGIYECLHCPDGLFYLNTGNIAKIGITTNGEKRYSAKKLIELRLQYVVVFEGSIDQVLKQEVIHIGQYPLMPENLVRPVEPLPELPHCYRIARPIMNTFDG